LFIGQNWIIKQTTPVLKSHVLQVMILDSCRIASQSAAVLADVVNLLGFLIGLLLIAFNYS